MSPPGKMLSGTSRGSAQKLKPSEVCIHHRAVLWLLAAWIQIAFSYFQYLRFWSTIICKLQCLYSDPNELFHDMS